jgi:hypothetical protein
VNTKSFAEFLADARGSAYGFHISYWQQIERR